MLLMTLDRFEKKKRRTSVHTRLTNAERHSTGSQSLSAPDFGAWKTITGGRFCPRLISACRHPGAGLTTAPENRAQAAGSSFARAPVRGVPPGAARRRSDPSHHVDSQPANEGSSAASGDLGRTASKVSLSTRIERRHRRDPASRLQRFVGWLSFLSHHNQFHQQMSGRALYGFRRWTGAASSETPAAPPGGASPRLGALMSGQYGCRRLSFPSPRGCGLVGGAVEVNGGDASEIRWVGALPLATGRPTTDREADRAFASGGAGSSKNHLSTGDIRRTRPGLSGRHGRPLR